MVKVDIAGLKINAISKKELLDVLADRVKSGQKTWATTPYSEFLHVALLDPELLKLLNRADLAVPDGISLFWAKRFLDIPLTAKSYWGKILQGLWQVKYTLAAIIFYPQWIKSALPEKISGADLIWDLAKLAADNGWSIYLLGGFGDTPKLAAAKLRAFPQLNRGRDLIEEIKIAGYSNKNPGDPTVIEDIKKASPDMLFVAYGPIKQEKWIAANLPNLPVKLAIGLGGTFDYLAGIQPQPPQFVRKIGLEWLWRLFTQPKRYKRIINATFGLISELLLFKIFRELPYRKNAVAVIIKEKKMIFIAQRNPKNKKSYIVKREKAKYKNYWQLPQGGINESEDIIEAAAREAGEETGIKKLKIIKISGRANQYDITPSWKRLFDKNYRYKGQNQNVVYFEFQDNENAIKIDEDEFINFKWVNIAELDKATHPERLPLAKIVMEDLKDLGYL